LADAQAICGAREIQFFGQNQICEIEKQHGFQLFTRNRKTAAQLTEAGRAFVQEARSALLHADRAIQLARVAQYGCENLLSVGVAPYADQGWLSTLLTIQLPQFRKVKVRLLTHVAIELVQSVLSNEIDLALVTAPPPDHKLTIMPFAQTQLCAVVPETHPAAPNEQVRLQHLAEEEWILFPRSANPVIHNLQLPYGSPEC
jgi:DNA-binding transcriptional LysR family regulator